MDVRSREVETEPPALWTHSGLLAEHPSRDQRGELRMQGTQPSRCSSSLRLQCCWAGGDPAHWDQVELLSGGGGAEASRRSRSFSTGSHPPTVTEMGPRGRDPGRTQQWAFEISSGHLLPPSKGPGINRQT